LAGNKNLDCSTYLIVTWSCGEDTVLNCQTL